MAKRPITRRKDGSDASVPMAARGYSRAPYEKGNQAHLVHGAFSEKVVTERASEIRSELESTCPWITSVDIIAVDTWCRAIGRRNLLHDHIERVVAEQGIESVKVYLWAEARGAETSVMKATEELGLSPYSRAKLLKELGQARYYVGKDGLVELSTAGRKLRQLRGRGGA